MKKRIFITAVVICVMALAFEVQAQRGNGKNRKVCGMGMGRQQGQMYCNNCVQWSSFSSDQQKNLTDLRLEFMKETLPARTRLQEKQLEMTTLMSKPEPESDKIMGLQKEISKLRAQMSTVSISYQLKARKLLTHEQIQNLPARCGLGFGCGFGQNCGMGMGQAKCGMNNPQQSRQKKGCCR